MAMAVTPAVVLVESTNMPAIMPCVVLTITGAVLIVRNSRMAVLMATTNSWLCPACSVKTKSAYNFDQV